VRSARQYRLRFQDSTRPLLRASGSRCNDVRTFRNREEGGSPARISHRAAKPHLCLEAEGCLADWLELLGRESGIEWRSQWIRSFALRRALISHGRPGTFGIETLRVAHAGYRSPDRLSAAIPGSQDWDPP